MRPGWTPLLLLAACGVHAPDAGPSAAAGSERSLSALGFAPGEHMEWEVRWFGVLVGRVQLAAGEPGVVDGVRALVIRSVAQSDGALAVAKRGQMELVTWVDLDRRRPLAQAGSFDEIYTGEVLGSRFGAAEWPRTAWNAALPGGEVAHSTHTAIGLLRGWRPEPGDRAHVFVRMRWRVLRLDLRAVGRQRITSALGRRAALRIDGVATPVGSDLEPPPGQKRFPTSFWIDDEGDERVPVRIDVESGFGGTVRLDLVTYDRATDVIARGPRAAAR
jgi:hypothetical protein